MKDEIVKNVLQYIEERTMADSDTTWKDVKLRFGGDPTYFIEGYLSRPAHYQAYKELVNKNNRNYIGIEISPEYIDIINKRLELTPYPSR